MDPSSTPTDTSSEKKEPEVPHHAIRDEEKSSAESTNTPEFDPAPDGGLEAWLCAAGAGTIFFACMGYSNAFGVYQEYYTSHQLRDRSPSDVAWIGSLCVFLSFLTGAIGGPMFDLYGVKMMRPAAVLYVVSIMMTSLCKEYWQFMLAQGVLSGATMGLLQFPAMAAVSQFFDKKKAAAMGIAVAGSSIGGVVIPIALSKMLNNSSIGFGWSVRIIGFLITPLMAFTCFTVKPRLPPRTSSIFIGGAFKDIGFVALIVSMFCVFLGMFTPLFFLPTYAVTRGTNATLASYLVAILNAASTFGRIIPGVLADVYGRLNTYAVASFATGIVILCMDKVNNTAGLVVFAVVYGFTSGAIISGVSVSFSVFIKDAQKFGTYMGMGMSLGACAALVGPPVSGALLHRYGGFLQVTIYSGVMCLVGGCIAIVSKATLPQGIFGKL